MKDVVEEKIDLARATEQAAQCVRRLNVPGVGGPVHGDWDVQLSHTGVTARSRALRNKRIEINTGCAHTALDMLELMILGLESRYMHHGPEEAPIRDVIEWAYIGEDGRGGASGFHRGSGRTLTIWPDGSGYIANVYGRGIKTPSGRTRRFTSASKAVLAATKDFYETPF